MNHPQRNLNALVFDNRFIRDLPCDPRTDNTPRRVKGSCYSRVFPTTVSSPALVAYSRDCAAILNLSEKTCNSKLFTSIFTGNTLLDGMDPFAMCYGGHQFGSWAGQLGDGRAINLGEIINEAKQRLTIQLKGAGPTPYSRSGDGLAVLRSSIREFLCSEAMFHLGVPTTRALCVTSTGEMVRRDMFYDGHPKDEAGAVVCRLAPSFLRFGNYEILSARNELPLLKQLVDHTILTYFPHLGPPSTNTYLQWFTEVCQLTANMIIQWMRVGFVHGVMNSDNMSILGLTIDYGPYGWLEGFAADWTPNTTDALERRYSYGNQPHIGQWNLVQLANSIYPLINNDKPLQQAIATYKSSFERGWNKMMGDKLGFDQFIENKDDTIIKELMTILQLVETDMTIFFRNLTTITEIDGTRIPPQLLDAYYKPEELTEHYKNKMKCWLRKYRDRLRLNNSSDKERQNKMNSSNPKYVLRNYLAHQAIEKANLGDTSMLKNLLQLLKRPYDEQPEYEQFAAKRPEWARNRPGCSTLSCSS